MQNLRHYTDDQLKSLLSDDSQIDSLIDALPQVSQLPSEREVKLAQSKSMAECNLSMEPQVQEARAKLSKTYTEALKTKQEVESLKEKLDNVAENRSLDVVSALLQAASREAEDESEKIAEQFANGQVEIAEFVRTFEEKRKLAHKRKVKSEKLAEILRSQVYPPAAANPPNRQSHPAAHGSTPYPVAYPPIPGRAPPIGNFGYPSFG
uniref:VPS37 C-terminal domain-containing protein n=1 Tax=Panagrellus redivivus TaxID=6233 RepID=A0A7E4VQN4_PANRE